METLIIPFLELLTPKYPVRLSQALYGVGYVRSLLLYMWRKKALNTIGLHGELENTHTHTHRVLASKPRSGLSFPLGFSLCCLSVHTHTRTHTFGTIQYGAESYWTESSNQITSLAGGLCFPPIWRVALGIEKD